MADEEKKEEVVNPIADMAKIMTGYEEEEKEEETDLTTKSATADKDTKEHEEEEEQKEEEAEEKPEEEAEEEEADLTTKDTENTKEHEEEKKEEKKEEPAKEQAKVETEVDKFWKKYSYLEDDDFLTAKQQRELDSAREADRRQEALSVERNNLARKAVKGFEAVTSELSAEKVGKGLDFKTVAKVGTENLSAKDWQDYANELKENPDPKAALKLFYDRCIARTPELFELKKTAGKSQETNNGKKPVNNAQNKKAGTDEKEEESLVGVRMKDVLGANQDMVRAMFGAK